MAESEVVKDIVGVVAGVPGEGWYLAEVNTAINELDGEQGSSHEEVATWLRSWGTAKGKIPPQGDLSGRRDHVPGSQSGECDAMGSNLETIKEAIGGLPEEERVALAAWLNLSGMDEWDQQMNRDFSRDGQALHLVDRVRAQVRDGKFGPMPPPPVDGPPTLTESRASAGFRSLYELA